jgi:hypothetical protein
MAMGNGQWHDGLGGVAVPVPARTLPVGVAGL